MHSRAAKLIARAGLASRREAEDWLLAGRVKYRGEILRDLARKLPSAAGLTIDGRPVPPPPRPRLWLYHKPLRQLSTRFDDKNRPVIFASLPAPMRSLLNVGRLDYMSEGLLLLTNHGGLKRHLELPVSGYRRRYRVLLDKAPDKDSFAPVERGLTLAGEVFRPAKVQIRPASASLWVRVELREGRKHEVRRLMQACGFAVRRLVRTHYGPFALGSLAAGDYALLPESKTRRLLPDFTGWE